MNTSEPQAAIRRKLLAAARLAKPARARPRQAKNGRALPSAWFLTDPDRTKNLLAVIGADGVHWPEARLRGVRKRSPHFIETASAHSRAGLARAHALGLDAAILSTVFPSRSPSASRAMGPLRFRLIARDAVLPVYALGGVNAHNAAHAMAHAAGWAAIDAVMSGWGD